MERQSCDKCVRWICGILFAAFAFCWLYFFQRELLRAANRVLFSEDNGLRIWMFNHHFVVSLALTVIAMLLAIPGRILMRFKKGLYSCNYLFSAAFLGVITGYDGDSLFGQSYNEWIVTGSFMLVLFLVCKIVASVPKSGYNDRSRTMAGNLLILSLLFNLTCYLGNTEENLHRRLIMERMYKEGRYEDLLDCGRNEEESDPAIDLLRAKAMLENPVVTNPSGSLIGESMFRYHISNPEILADALLDMDNTEAYLTSCLLKRDLSSFCDSIDLKEYNSVPTFYMQALVIAQDSLAAVEFPQQYQEETSRYESFLKDVDDVKVEPLQFQANSTFIDYHESYFWYYTFCK